MIWEAFLLGLSSGTYCAAACAPVALPFLSSRPDATAPYRRNAGLIALFLLGRLIGYIAIGAVLGAIGAYALSYVDPGLARGISRAANAVAGALMIAAGLAEGRFAFKACLVARRVWKPAPGAFAFGLLTGLSVCPPFFAAASRVFAAGAGASALSGAGYFFFFFTGTSVWLLPFFALPALVRHSDTARFLARSVMTMVGAYLFLIVGLLGVN
jgi:sulfite exporter TauE/SafE